MSEIDERLYLPSMKAGDLKKRQTNGKENQKPRRHIGDDQPIS
jgi:hypothetical protein